MKEAVSCGGVVIFRGKILLLFKNYKNRYNGWVLPKGAMEEGETQKETALREVKEETAADARIIEYLGPTEYSFGPEEAAVHKVVHWYLMMGENYSSKPQRSEFFTDSGYYKYHEAYYLLKYDNERNVMDKAYKRYLEIRRDGKWHEQN